MTHWQVNLILVIPCRGVITFIQVAAELDHGAKDISGTHIARVPQYSGLRIACRVAFSYSPSFEKVATLPSLQMVRGDD